MFPWFSPGGMRGYWVQFASKRVMWFWTSVFKSEEKKSLKGL